MNRSNIAPILIAAVVLTTVILVTVFIQIGLSSVEDSEHTKVTEIPIEFSSPVTPFTDIAAMALDNDHKIWNDRPGIAVFDYDRDGDLDFYITSDVGHANFLYRNDGNRKRESLI